MGSYGEKFIHYIWQMTHVGDESYLTTYFWVAFYMLGESFHSVLTHLDKDLGLSHCALTLAGPLWLTFHFWEILCSFLWAAQTLAI